ncbi:GMC oxidoreductase [Periconia macrospinosa]|uniref:GMC oxidoreductase n=1 Tax=Periconia macrospinosa TaxID=97972 RepID=A0A2V1DXP0_9PLEO|nr:GMC oxidoreductase [Periconia macrospinosa]
MNATTHDIVIVGGGTAGLVLANRLSEDPSLSVLVLEAGIGASSDPRVLIPGFFSSLAGSEHDWNFETVPQKNLDGRIIGHVQGKVLGGSSAVNAQALIPPSASDVNRWQELGNLEWNYQTLKPYLDKWFKLSLPSQEVSEHLQISWADAEPFQGAVNASFAGAKADPLPNAWVKTFETLNHRLTANPFDGHSIGAYNGPSTIDNTTKTRSYSDVAYYQPVATRPNLQLITGVSVSEIIIDDALRATGVKYTQDGIEKTVQARTDIILSAGVFNSPKLLELSGVGDPSILNSSGINVKVDNKYVGTNLQDHVVNGISYEVKDGITTGDDLLRGDQATLAAAMAAYQTNQTGPLVSSGITSFAYLPTQFSGEDSNSRSALLDMLANPQLNHPLDAQRYSFARKLLSEMSEGTAQYFLFAAQTNAVGRNTNESIAVGLQEGNFITLVAGLSHPISSGTVHISSSNPADKPTIDHQYLSNSFDVELHARHITFLEKLAATEPMASLLKPNGARNHPAAFIGADIDKAKEYAKVGASTNWHSVGTCAMAPAHLGGVVDSNFNVYGVKGLRIVDASVIPFVPQSNTQSMVYAIAERAADLIKKSI